MGGDPPFHCVVSAHEVGLTRVPRSQDNKAANLVAMAGVLSGKAGYVATTKGLFD